MPHMVAVIIIILHDETEYLSKHFCYTQKYDCLQEQSDEKHLHQPLYHTFFLKFISSNNLFSLYMPILVPSCSPPPTYQIFFTWKNEQQSLVQIQRGFLLLLFFKDIKETTQLGTAVSHVILVLGGGARAKTLFPYCLPALLGGERSPSQIKTGTAAPTFQLLRKKSEF